MIKTIYELEKEELLAIVEEKNRKQRERSRKIYLRVKDKRAEQYKAKREQYLCECGRTILKQTKAQHERTLKHREFIQKKIHDMGANLTETPDTVKH